MAVLAVALSCLSMAAACSKSSSTGGGAGGAAPGAITIDSYEEPSCLNPLSTCTGSGYITMVANAMLIGAYIQKPDNTMIPGVIDGEAKVTEDPFTVTYNIRSNAKWSDGQPVTAQDFAFTLSSIVDKKSTALSTNGYTDITKTTINSDKSVTFTFSSNYAPYKQLFNYILPSHLDKDVAFNSIDLNSIDASDGPYKFVSWTKGQTLKMVKNPYYYGTPAAIDKVNFRFVADKDTIIQQLQGGEADVFDDLGSDAAEIQQLKGVSGIKVDSTPGLVFDQIRPNENNPLLAKQFVRQAIAGSIDRNAVIKTLIAPIDPTATPTTNMYYEPGSPQFKAEFDYKYDPGASIALLQRNGCTKGSDGVFSCDGKKLSFSYVGVSGSTAGQLLFQLLQANMKAIGVQLNANFVDANTAYGKLLPGGQWDFIEFAPGFYDPSLGDRFLTCGAQPYYAYCNKQVDALLKRGATTVDETARASIYNQAQSILANDVVWIPLYNLTGTVAYRSSLTGLTANGNGYSTWNIQDWK